MKSRNREINIFNMSLLDILCGALGAFCFMMIVLLPYYKPENVEDQKKQKDLDDTIKSIDDLTKKLADAKLSRELQELIEKLKAQIKELEGRVNSLTQENKQLADKNQQLQKEKDDLLQKNKDLTEKSQQLENRNQQLQKDNNQLSMRLPGVLVGYSITTLPIGQYGAMDLIVWAPNPNPGSPSPPPFNPNVITNGVYFTGDAEVPLFSNSPTTIFLYRDVAPEVRQKVYIKVRPITLNGNNPPTMLPLTTPMKVSGMLSSGSPSTFIQLPEVDLTPEHPWMLIGFLETNPDRSIKFVPATPAERTAEWRALDKH